MKRIVTVGFVCTWAWACGGEAPPQPAGAVSVGIASLSLGDIGFACFDVRVTNAPAGAGEIVWQQGDPGTTRDLGDGATLCSSRFGSGTGGDLTYIGACDADGPDRDGDGLGERDNSVTVWVDGLYTAGGARIESDGVSTWRDPCPNGCTLGVVCEENSDASVVFDLTVLRAARQGFFDVAVTFEDIFCSAKADSCRGGTPLALLLHHGEEDATAEPGGRYRTAVAAFTCTTGPGLDGGTLLHMSTPVIACDDEVTCALDPAREGGNHVATCDDGSAVAYALYHGDQGVACGGDEPCQAIYWNIAVNIADLVAAGHHGCALAYAATATPASGAPYDGGALSDPNATWPVITWSAPLTEDDGTPSCDASGLDGGGAVATEYDAGANLLATDPTLYQAPPLCHRLGAGGAMAFACGPPDPCAGTPDTLTGDVVVTSPAELDALGCVKHIAGNFTLDGTAVTTVSLPRLVTVGDVSILRNAAMTSIDMPALTTAGNMIIAINVGLVSMSFPSLATANGLFLNKDIQLVAVSFPALTSLGHTNPLYIGSAPALTSISFPLLTEAHEVSVSPGSQVTTLSLPKLAQVSGPLSFWGMPLVSAIALPSLVSVEGLFAVRSSGAVSLSAPTLTSVDGLELTTNAALAAFDLTSLAAIGATNDQTLSVHDNAALSECLVDDLVAQLVDAGWTGGEDRYGNLACP